MRDPLLTCHGCQPGLRQCSPVNGSGTTGRAALSPTERGQRRADWLRSLLLLAILAIAALLSLSGCVSAKGQSAGKEWAYKSLGTDTSGLAVSGDGIQSTTVNQSASTGAVIKAVRNAAMLQTLKAAAPAP